MSLRAIYYKVQEIHLDFKSEWDAAHQWASDFGEFAARYVRDGGALQPPKTPLPKQRQSKCTVLANPMTNSSFTFKKSRRKSSKSSVSSLATCSNPPFEILEDDCSNEDEEKLGANGGKDALQEISNMPSTKLSTASTISKKNLKAGKAKPKRTTRNSSKATSSVSTYESNASRFSTFSVASLDVFGDNSLKEEEEELSVKSDKETFEDSTRRRSSKRSSISVVSKKKHSRPTKNSKHKIVAKNSPKKTRSVLHTSDSRLNELTHDAKTEWTVPTKSKGQGDVSASSSNFHGAASNKAGLKKQGVVKNVESGAASMEKVQEAKIATDPSCEDNSAILNEYSTTPRRSVILDVPIPSTRRLMNVSFEREVQEDKKVPSCSSMPGGKKSVPGRQIFSPYALSSTKEKAEAYENHIAQFCTVVETPENDRRKKGTRWKNSNQCEASPQESPVEQSKSRKSAAKRKSSEVKPGDRLIFAKAAKMSETQRRSSLVRYHLRVGVTQVVRRLSAEKRRSLGEQQNRTVGASVEHPIQTIEEHVSPKRSADKELFESYRQSKRLKATQPQKDEEPQISTLNRLSASFSSARDSLEECKTRTVQVVVERLSEELIAKLSGQAATEKVSLSAQVIVNKLNEEDIAEYLEPRSPTTSLENDDDSSDSYISVDEDQEGMTMAQASTPVMQQMKKKMFKPDKLLKNVIRNTSLPKHVYPGSEPRLTHLSRVAYLTSILNSSAGPIKRSLGSSGSVAPRSVTSFLGSKLARPPSFSSAQKTTDHLKEELMRKQEKEKQVLKRRDQILKNKVLSQKKKLDDRRQKAAENRLQKEREQQDKNKALELQLQKAEEKKRVQAEKRREQMEQKRLLRVKKEADIEERRKQEEAVKLARLKEQEALEKVRVQELLKCQQEQEQVRHLIQQHNSSLQKNTLQKKAVLNSTVTVEQPVNVESETKTTSQPPPTNLNQTYNCEHSVLSDKNYDITPHRSELPTEELKNPENYDIADLNSGDETDNEESPRKKIPNWAQAPALNVAVLRQIKYPPNLEALFPQMPNLDMSQVFKTSKMRKRVAHRTSSAIWTSPIGIE